MNVLMLNTFDNVAGADRAARRLQQGLRRAGVEARLLVQFKSGTDPEVLCLASPLRIMLRRLKLYLGTLPVRFYPHKPVNNFTPALLPDRLATQVSVIAPDLVHLHWLGAGFCRIESLSHFKRPLIWTLHDSWPFTGGCHIPGSCLKYREACGACPVLGSRREHDLSRWTWKRKARAWRDLPLTLVAPSHWLADCARASSLFRGVRVEVIPNGIDTTVFRPLEKRAARALLGLPQERTIVLFGAVNALSDTNKGWPLLQAALRIVSASRPDLLAVVFGGAVPAQQPETGLETIFLGRLSDDAALIAAYSAADVFVAPSLQESFCQTVLEAMACGTPAVAFGATGLLDLIEHHRTGYLAAPYDVNDLARGILWILDEERHAALAEAARQRATDAFDIELVTTRYLALYHTVLTADTIGLNIV